MITHLIYVSPVHAQIAIAVLLFGVFFFAVVQYGESRGMARSIHMGYDWQRLSVEERDLAAVVAAAVADSQ